MIELYTTKTGTCQACNVVKALFDLWKKNGTGFVYHLRYREDLTGRARCISIPAIYLDGQKLLDTEYMVIRDGKSKIDHEKLKKILMGV